MAHNLNYNEENKEYSFFSTKERAWHGLGKIVDQYPTSAEAIKYAGLDYEVIKSPLFTCQRDEAIEDNMEITGGDQIAVPNHFATARNQCITRDIEV